MLLELSIENYAVIDRLRVCFHPGLNLLTGETGSGKSIVVDALALLLGGRASADMIRSGQERARISGRFTVPAERVASLEAAGLVPEDGELLIEREILAGGKSRAYVGSRPVAAALLRDLAPYLGDIHGQHDQQLLFSPDAQLAMLDAFGRHEALLGEVASLYRSWREIGTELEELERTEQEKLRLLDLWTFQRKEIEQAAPRAGEEEQLENERRILLNLSRLQEGAGTAYAALYDSPESAHALLRTAVKRLEEMARIDRTLGEAAEMLRPAELAVQEASYLLRDYLSRLEANPGRLEEIESRLAALDKLKRKYGNSVELVLAFLEDVRGKIAGLEHAGERMEELRRQRAALAAAFEAAAGRLSAGRKEAAQHLRKQVEKELASLAMERTVFQVEIRPQAWTASGADGVRFLVSPNVGEEPRPLERVASGGEISRIALALKTCVAAPRGGTARTLVFDEVDAGVGGSAAEGVGRRLKQLAGANQVLCVTHLPQIASFADHHYRVEKREVEGRTAAGITELAAAQRVQEIGRMLSGQKLTAEALKNAEQLLKMARGARS
ncbi:MAG: DNA repair protein RecN [Bryobacterales bacterium]|nr:DNA repair protein RecN [Bryobacterales bacterium]